MSKRWHEKTNNFHLPIWKMVVILDSVTYLLLLHIPVEGKKMRNKEETSYEKGVELMMELMGDYEEEAMEEIGKQWGGYVGIHLWSNYMRGTIVRQMGWRMHTEIRRRDITDKISVWGISFSFWLVLPYSPIRETSTSTSYGSMGCMISPGYLSGHGVGWHGLISPSPVWGFWPRHGTIGEYLSLLEVVIYFVEDSIIIC